MPPHPRPQTSNHSCRQPSCQRRRDLSDASFCSLQGSVAKYNLTIHRTLCPSFTVLGSYLAHSNTGPVDGSRPVPILYPLLRSRQISPLVAPTFAPERIGRLGVLLSYNAAANGKGQNAFASQKRWMAVQISTTSAESVDDERR